MTFSAKGVQTTPFYGIEHLISDLISHRELSLPLPSIKECTGISKVNRYPYL
ncbi:MAG: hypothetical protein QGI45_04650 [Myxococcota bacterium]|nr:hypothetical protein [Myxococcota bacterium]